MSLANVMPSSADTDTLLPVQAPLSPADMSRLAQASEGMFERVREMMFQPERQKVPPMLSHSALARLLGIGKDALDYRMRSRPDLPRGTLRKKTREFTIAECQAWVRATRGPVRPEGKDAVVITIGNFKGGVTKTTTAVSLAQGLSLHGYTVLVIDLDPQASATVLLGVNPARDVSVENTLYELFFGREGRADASYAVVESYWPNVDLIASAMSMFGAEFGLAGLTARGQVSEFWGLLDRGLQTLRKRYDAIIIDTAPALSLLNINALFAADGLLVPVPPKALDYASSVSFWRLFDDSISWIADSHEQARNKRWHFAYVVPTKVQNDAANAFVHKWLVSTYAEKILPVDIPATVVESTASTSFGTCYDIGRYEGSAKAFARARDAYDRMVELIDISIQRVWKGALPTTTESS